MKRSHIIVAAVVLLVLVAGFWFWQRSRTSQTAIDLLALYPSVPTELRRSNLAIDAAFNVGDHAIGSETRKAIYMHPTSRLTFAKVLIPDDARLQAWVGVKQDAWDKPSDGVLFRIGVTSAPKDSREKPEHVEVFNQHVDPAHNPNDRRWVPVDIDLSAFAGQQVDLILNTNSSVPGAGDNSSYDFAVWGSPAVIVRY